MDGLSAVFFPKVCVICKKASDKELCTECVRLVERSDPVPCRDEILFPFGNVFFFARYGGVLKEAFVRYKFKGEIWLGNAFGNMLFHHFEKYFTPAEYDFLTYIPVSREGRRERGFDQCEEMVRSLTKKSGIPTVKLLSCSAMKKKQSSLDREERGKNVSGRFALKEDLAESELKGKRILLLDDVFTTGATLRSCAGLLSDAGAERVDAVVFATGRADIGRRELRDGKEKKRGNEEI